MGNIVLLDDLTINKIAAGEVIERPASVIKEMIENSIDAGAKNITVEIKNGGISYIRVTDDGKGIASDDLEIAFERHATSKIRCADDLENVKSMGFRGEALASIAAIANVELVSKTNSQETGYKITVEGGKVLNKEEIGCPTGTTITVKNLFYNTPVRYKFLKKDYTESGYIEDAITRIALVNPNISFKLINTGKTVIQTNGNGDLKTVVYSIYGKDVADGILNVNYNYEDINIVGVVGKPEIARSNRSNQLFFVNKRYIKDKTLSSATEQAFKGMLPIGKFGFVVLDLEMDPSKVDVNVHPAKLEVRFEDENKVFKAIYHAIKDTLLKSELVANTTKESVVEDVTKRIETINDEKKLEEKIQLKENKDEPSLFKRIEEINKKNEEKSALVNTPKVDIPESTENILNQLKQLQEKLKKETEENKKKEEIEIEEHERLEEKGEKIKETEEEKENVIVDEIKEENENSETERKEETPSEIAKNEEFKKLKEQIDMLRKAEEQETENFDQMYEKTFGNKPIGIIQEEKEAEKQIDAEDILENTENVSVFEDIEEYNKPTYKFIGIAFKTYIILEMNKEMYILDQHAAHERIMYEQIKKNYYNNSTKDSQMLLLPDVITLTHKEMDIAKENMDMFRRAGFTLEEFGENTIKLSGVPNICVDLDTKELFLETLDEINTVARTAKQEKEEKFIATVACKAAVKANMALTKEEVDSLMDQLLKLPNPFTCPHGRPTAIKMTKYDIERKFARK